MQSLREIKDIIQTFGLFSFVIFAVYAVNKAWPAIISGSKQAQSLATWIATQYLSQMTDRIQLETKIDIKLGTLAQQIGKYLEELTAYERRNSERVEALRNTLTDQLRNIEFVLSDKVFSELNELRGLFDDHVDEIGDVLNTARPAKACKHSLQVGTEEFRKLRAAGN